MDEEYYIYESLSGYDVYRVRSGGRIVHLFFPPGMDMNLLFKEKTHWLCDDEELSTFLWTSNSFLETKDKVIIPRQDCSLFFLDKHELFSGIISYLLDSIDASYRLLMYLPLDQDDRNAMREMLFEIYSSAVYPVNRLTIPIITSFDYMAMDYDPGDIQTSIPLSMTPEWRAEEEEVFSTVQSAVGRLDSRLAYSRFFVNSNR